MQTCIDFGRHWSRFCNSGFLLVYAVYFIRLLPERPWEWPKEKGKLHFWLFAYFVFRQDTRISNKQREKKPREIVSSSQNGQRNNSFKNQRYHKMFTQGTGFFSPLHRCQSEMAHWTILGYICRDSAVVLNSPLHGMRAMWFSITFLEHILSQNFSPRQTWWVLVRPHVRVQDRFKVADTPLLGSVEISTDPQLFFSGSYTWSGIWLLAL